MTVLRVLRRVPSRTAFFLAFPGLRVYPYLRRSHSRAIQARWATGLPEPLAGKPLSLHRYYESRFRLALRCLKIHGGPLPVSGEPGFRVRILGGEHYADALRLGRPIVLLGWHQGIVELLHRVPPAPPGRPFRILTAEAFAPALTRFMRDGREVNGKRVLVASRARKEPGSTVKVPPLDRSNAYPGVSGIRDVIREAGILAVMVDQHPTGFGAGGVMELFGRLAVPYPQALMHFLIRNGCVFLSVSTRLLPDGGSEFRYHALADAEEVNPPEESVLREKLRGLMETAILAAPDQWNWSYGNTRIIR